VISVTDAELSYITEKIWISDGNRVKDSDVPYNTKGPKLFGKVNSEAFVKKPTFATMIALFGNYNEDLTGSSVSRKQEDAFLDAILYTRPIEKAYNWLYGRGLTSSPTLKVFKDELRQYWFARNTRQQGGSNGFTHVFLGEFDNGRVKGLHNWVRMYLAERDGIFAYRGHKKGCEPAIEEVEFDWKLTYHKTSSSLFIRTSPEVEIALYTVCLLARPNGCCHIQLKSNDKWLTPAITASDKKDPKYTFKTISTAFPQCNC
jgi:poly(U)-specific endoribonuclease